MSVHKHCDTIPRQHSSEPLVMSASWDPSLPELESPEAAIRDVRLGAEAKCAVAVEQGVQPHVDALTCVEQDGQNCSTKGNERRACFGF